MGYFDHALTILEIGTYIRERIEPKIQNLTDPYIMTWEKDYKVGIIYNLRFRAIICLGIVFLTFGGPSIICIALCLLYPWLQKYSNSLKILLTSTPTPDSLVLGIIILIDLIFFVALVSLVFLIGPRSNKSRLNN